VFTIETGCFKPRVGLNYAWLLTTHGFKSRVDFNHSCHGFNFAWTTIAHTRGHHAKIYTCVCSCNWTVLYCKSCHTCQVVGKPNQMPNPAPLKLIPAIEESFSRVLVECMEPLPKTRSGNQYLLTIMFVNTRFPEAIPVRNIKASTIVKALLKFFTFVGLPRHLQSDQGSNFMSGIFQQVMHQLGITQCKSSAYDPQSQGAIEHFHQTLKTMMRMYCVDCDKNWVHLLLFAVRESIQDCLA